MDDPSGHWPKWIKKAATAVKNFFCPPQTVKNKVPLYNQGSTSLCWAYSQTMVESFNNKTKLKQKEADARARELAVAKNGADNWNQGNWPDGVDPSNRVTIANITELYDLVVEKGPVYAYYANADSAHLVVVTGVSVYKNQVYTNNPWGVKGKQSFEGFQDGFATKRNQDGQGMTFGCIYLYD